MYIIGVKSLEAIWIPPWQIKEEEPFRLTDSRHQTPTSTQQYAPTTTSPCPASQTMNMLCFFGMVWARIVIFSWGSHWWHREQELSCAIKMSCFAYLSCCIKFYWMHYVCFYLHWQAPSKKLLYQFLLSLSSYAVYINFAECGSHMWMQCDYMDTCLPPFLIRTAIFYHSVPC